MAKSKNNSRQFSQDFSEGGKTQQHFKASCDVNAIIAQFTQTGIDPSADRLSNQKFGFATAQSFSDAMQATAEIHSAFASLPSPIRSEFSNDPSEWFTHVMAQRDPSEEISPPESSQEPLSVPETPSDTPPTTPAEKDG